MVYLTNREKEPIETNVNKTKVNKWWKSKTTTSLICAIIVLSSALLQAKLWLSLFLSSFCFVIIIFLYTLLTMIFSLLLLAHLVEGLFVCVCLWVWGRVFWLRIIVYVTMRFVCSIITIYLPLLSTFKYHSLTPEAASKVEVFQECFDWLRILRALDLPLPNVRVY